MSVDNNLKNRKVSWEWCQYASGPFDGLFVVRKKVIKDHCAFLSQGEAQAFIKRKEKKSVRSTNG